jgi:hypothetical protein
MKKIDALWGLSILVAASLAIAPSPSHSASKGRSASPPPGKSTVGPPSRAPLRPPGKGLTAAPGGKGTSTTPGGKGKGTARQVWKIPSACRRDCERQVERCIGDLSKDLQACFDRFDACITRCGGPGPAFQAR